MRRTDAGGTVTTLYHWTLDDGRPDLTVSGAYSRSGGFNTATVGVSIPLPVFDRNQGEVARTRAAVVPAEEQRAAVTGQVMTDVKDSYEGLGQTDRIVSYCRSGYLDIAQRSRDISQYAYKRGGTSLFDFLDAERSYRATELGYRQALAAYLLALEQLREAVATRALPRGFTIARASYVTRFRLTPPGAREEEAPMAG